MNIGRKHFGARCSLVLISVLAFCLKPLPGNHLSEARSLFSGQTIASADDPGQSFPIAGRWLQVTGPVGNVKTLSIIGNRLLTASEPGINLSTDNGASWLPAYNTSLTKNVDSFATIGAMLFAGTPVALVASTDSGASWSGINYDPRNPVPTGSLAVIGNRLFAIRNFNISASTDQGTS